jgi:hypothetical protein
MTQKELNKLHTAFWSAVTWDHKAQPHVKPAPPVMTEDPRAWHVSGSAVTEGSKSK